MAAGYRPLAQGEYTHMATTQKQTSTVDVEAQIAALLSTKAVSSGSKSLAQVFEQLARENNHIVTFEQAKAASPKSPSDLAFYFRQALGKCMTVKGKDGKTYWEVQKLSNGKMGHPAEVKALLSELQTKKQ